jgi:hypothetical protein
MVGWTTVTSQKDARNMVHNLLESKLIACGEIEGPFLNDLSMEAKKMLKMMNGEYV